MSTLPLNHSPADEVFKSDRLRSCSGSRHEEHKWHLLQIQTNQGIQCAVGGADGSAGDEFAVFFLSLFV